jgi:peptide chain release factor 2
MPRKHLGSWAQHRRTYVLAPYETVSDHRTGVQSGDPQAVLDGRIDEFIDVGIRQRAAERRGQAT